MNLSVVVAGLRLIIELINSTTADELCLINMEADKYLRLPTLLLVIFLSLCHNMLTSWVKLFFLNIP